MAQAALDVWAVIVPVNCTRAVRVAGVTGGMVNASEPGLTVSGWHWWP